MIGTLLRDKEEIIAESQTIAEYKENNPAHFERLRYEDGYRAAILWLFYYHEPAPSDRSPMTQHVHPAPDALVQNADSTGEN